MEFLPTTGKPTWNPTSSAPESETLFFGKETGGKVQFSTTTLFSACVQELELLGSNLVGENGQLIIS
jgi:hypothetical protein